MINFLLLVIIMLMSPFFVFGLFIFIQLLRPSKPPADESNRINRIRLLWFALTRQELFVGPFPWMKNDELDNLKNIS